MQDYRQLLGWSFSSLSLRVGLSPIFVSVLFLTLPNCGIIAIIGLVLFLSFPKGKTIAISWLGHFPLFHHGQDDRQCLDWSISSLSLKARLSPIVCLVHLVVFPKDKTIATSCLVHFGSFPQGRDYRHFVVGPCW